jgi:hypothetical protein
MTMNKITTFQSLATACLLLSTTSAAVADDAASTPPAAADPAQPTATEVASHRVGLETDVMTLLRGGAGFLVTYQSEAMGPIRISAGANKSALPSFVFEEGGSADFWGGSLNGYYHFGKHGRGWFAGAQIMVRRETYHHVSAPGESAKSTMIDPSPLAGYRWFPASRGPYIMAFAKLGVPIRVSGDTKVGDMNVEWRLPISPYIGVHLGWEIGS